MQDICVIYEISLNFMKLPMESLLGAFKATVEGVRGVNVTVPAEKGARRQQTRV